MAELRKRKFSRGIFLYTLSFIGVMGVYFILTSVSKLIPRTGAGNQTLPSPPGLILYAAVFRFLLSSPPMGERARVKGNELAGGGGVKASLEFLSFQIPPSTAIDILKGLTC
jgi:hypothetical protein